MQSWDRRTSQAFIWGRTVFVSPLGSMRLNKQGVRSAPHTYTHTHGRGHIHMHAYTNTSKHTSANTHQPMGSLIVRPVYFGCEFGCPAGTWDWWTDRAVQQTRIQRHTHAVPVIHCARLQRLPATSHKDRQRQRKEGRTKCAWVYVGRRKIAGAEKDVEKKRKRRNWLLITRVVMVFKRMKLKLPSVK